MTLRELARAVIFTYDRRLEDEISMLAFGQAVEKLRAALGSAETFDLTTVVSEPEAMPLELQAMSHVSKVLGALPPPARFRTIMVVALAMAPEVFSDREYGAFLKRAKGS